MSDLTMTTQELLDELFKPEAHEHWMHHPQKGFGGLSAFEMIEAGREEEVQALLHGLADGVFS